MVSGFLSLFNNPTFYLVVGGFMVLFGGFLQNFQDKETLEQIIKVQKQTIKEFQNESYRIATGYDSWVKIVPQYRRLSQGGEIELLLQYVFFGKYPIPDAKMTISKTTLDGLANPVLINGTVIQEKFLGVLSRQDNFQLLDKLIIDNTPFVVRIDISSRSGSQSQDIIVDIDKEGQLRNATRIWHTIIDVEESAEHESGAQSETIAHKYKNISPGFPKDLLDKSSGFYSWTKRNWEITDNLPTLVYDM